MTQKLAVFDWNGTLFNDVEASVYGANVALAKFGKGPITTQRYQDSFTFPIVHFYAANDIPVDSFLARHEEASLAYMETYEKEALNCHLHHDAIDLLQWLKKQNFRILLLSNHLQENLMISLKRFGITEFFDDISGNEQYDAAFITKMNKQERLESYMREYDISPNKAFIIGDSHEEQEIARHLGLSSFSITGGYYAEDRLKRGNPDYLVHSLEDVVDILSKKWSL